MIDITVHRSDNVTDEEFNKFMGHLNLSIYGESWGDIVTVDTPDEVPIDNVGQIFFRVSTNDGKTRYVHKNPSELRKTIKMLVEGGKPIDEIKIDLVTDIKVY